VELLTRNAVVRAKHAEVEGVRYVIAPMTLIVPGVLAGSQGALYYPASEIAKNYRQWEGVPVVVNHPTDPLTGINQSAYDDGVQERSGVGVLKNVRIGRGGKLQADGWIDVAKAAQVDPVIIGNILNGVPVELSTGLFTTNLPAEPGAACPRTGKPYQAIATDYRPDHLAVLSNGVPGACSLKDGCGVLVNKAFPTSPRVSPTTPTSSQAETSALPLHTSSPQGDRVGGLVGDSPSLNVFCATGIGGGIDPSCKRGESRQAPPEHPNPASRAAAEASSGLLRQAAALRHYPHEEAANAAAYAADEAERAAQAGNLKGAQELHRTAALRHEDAATALRGSRRGKAAQQAIEDHLKAAELHRDAAREALYGRDQVGQSVRVLRDESGARSLEALTASKGLNRAAQVLAQEAAVASDKAQDSSDPHEASQLHLEAARLHGRASDQHGLAHDHYRDAGQGEEAARELQAATSHTTARRWHTSAADLLKGLRRTGHVANEEGSADLASNVFCATGAGGGVDPSCKKGESRQADPPEPGSSQAKRASDRAHEATSRLRVREHRLAAAMDSSTTAVQTSAQAAHARDPELHNRAAWHHSGAYDALVEAAPHYAQHPAESQALEEAAQAHLEAARYHLGARDELQHGGRDGHNRAVQRQREQAAEASQAALRETMAAPAETDYAQEARRLAEEAAVASDRAYDEKDPTAAYEAHRAAYKAHDLAREAHYLATGQTASDRESWEAHRRAMRAHNTAADAHGETWQALRRLAYLGHVANVFCKTGKDGGVDPTCKKDGSASGKGGVKTDPDKKPTPAADTSPRKPRTESAESALAGTLSDKGYDVLRPLNTKRDVRELARQAQAAARKASSATNPEAARAYHLSAADYHNKVMSKLVFKSLFGKKSDAAWVVHSQARQAHLKAAVASGPSKAVAEQALQQRQLAQELTLAAQAPSKRAGGRASASADQAAILAGRALYEVDSGEAASLHARAAGAHRTAAADHTTRGNQAHSKEEKKEHAEAARLHTQARETHTTAAYQLRALKKQGHVTNVFCATGEGGGIDPSCKKGESRQAPPEEHRRAALRGVAQAVEHAYSLLPANMRRSVDGETLMHVLEMAGRAEERGDAKALDGLYTRLHEVSRRLFDGYRRLPNTPTGGPDSEDPAYALVEASMMAQGARAELRQGRGHTHRLVSDLRDAASSSSLRAMEATQASGLEPSHPVYQQAARAAILSDAALEERQIEPAIRAHRDAAGEHQVAASDLHQLSYAAHDRGDSDSAARLAQAAQRHDAAFRRHENAVEELEQAAKLGHTTNVFCTTGVGGGVDPSCKKGESRQTPPDLPGTVAVLKRSRDALQVAEETAPRTPALEAAFTRAREAVRLAEQADEATTAEEATRLHEDARQVHQGASRLFYQQGQAQAGDWQRWSAGAHRQAAREAEQGRGTVMRDVRRQREFAQEASQRALAAGRGLGGGPVTEREQEAAVRSDMAFDEEDPARAAELHRQAGHLHEQVAYSRWRDARRAADEGEAIEERLRRSYEAHDLAREAHADAATELDRLTDTGHVRNVFCATGKGGGVDPGCKKGESRQAPPDKSEYAVTRAKSAARESRTAAGAAMSSGYQAIGIDADRARSRAREAERLTEAGDIEGAKRAHLEASEAHDEVVRAIGHTYNPALREVSRLNQDAGAQHREIVLELEKGIGAAERELQDDRDVASNRTAQALSRSRAIPPGPDNGALAIAEEASIASDEAMDEREINRAVELHRRAAELHRRAVVAHQGPVIDDSRYNYLHDRAASMHVAAAEWHEAASRNLARAARRGHTLNTFCATGENGGVDPSCSRHKEGSLKRKAKKVTRAAFKALTFSPESTSRVAARSAEEAAATGTRAGYVQAVYHHLRAAQKFENPPGDWLADDADREKYAKLAERHRQAAEHYKRKVLVRGKTTNVFCATGEGGGVDPSCGKGERRESPPRDRVLRAEARAGRAVQDAVESTDAALRAMRALAGDRWDTTFTTKHDLIEQASVLKDQAYDTTDPETAAALHERVAKLHAEILHETQGPFGNSETEAMALAMNIRALNDHTAAAAALRSLARARQRTDNVFCATGDKGGVDPSCGKNGGSKAGVGRGQTRQSDPPAHHGSTLAADASGKATWATQRSGNSQAKDLARTAGQHALLAAEHARAGRTNEAVAHHQTASNTHQAVVGALKRKQVLGEEDMHKAHAQAALAHDAAASELKQGRGAVADDVRRHRGAAGAATARAFEASNRSTGKYDRRPAEDAAVLSDQASDEQHPETAARLHHQAGAAHGVAAEVHAKAGHREAAAAHRAASEEHRTVARRLHGLHMTGHVSNALQCPPNTNVFCPTGEGGGVKPDCKAAGLATRVVRRTGREIKEFVREFKTAVNDWVSGKFPLPLSIDPDPHGGHTRLKGNETKHLAGIVLASIVQQLDHVSGGRVLDAELMAPALRPFGNKLWGKMVEYVRRVRGRTDNVFCATGKGGGVDPSCKKGRGVTRQSDPRVDHIPGLAIAVWAATAEHEGADPADWAVLADVMTDQDDPLARSAAYLSRIAALAVSGHRLAATLRHHLRARAAGGPVALATLLGVLRAHGAPADTADRGWAGVYRRVRYVGHHRLVGSQQRELERLWEATRSAGGSPSDAQDEAVRLRIEALAIAEANGEGVANVFCATGQGGGIDPSCKRDGSSGSRGEAVREAPPDHPHTASVEAGKHSDAAYEATRGLTGLQAVKRHASAARNAARRAAEATDPEDAGNNHLNAADAHNRAAFGLELSYARGAAAARRIHAEAASAHRTAASELKLGREELVKRVRGYREHAGKSSGTALESSQKAGGPAVALAEEAAVASDLAQDETDPKRAAELHRDAAVLHSRAAFGLELSYARGDRLQAEAMWVHRRAYANHLEVAESLRQLARIGHTINARGTPNTNVFCATGQGGGVDPSCKKSDSAETASRQGKGVSRQAPPPDPAGDVSVLTQSLLHATLAVPHRAAHSPVGRAVRAAQEAAVASDRAQDASNGVTAARAHSEAAEFHTEAHTLLYRSGNPARGGFYSSKDRRDKVALAMRHADAAEAHLAMKALRLGDDTLGGRVLNEPESAYSWEVRTLRRWEPTPTHGRPTLAGDVYAFHRILRVTGYPEQLSLPGALDYRQYDTPAEARAAAMDAKTRLRRILIESTGRMG